MDLEKKVYEFETNSELGFTPIELELILLEFPDINREKVNDVFFGGTVGVVDGIIRYYKHDVLLALKCGIENRDLNVDEWD
tara:strand:+ start:127888 stop:128130 length:243 start_codon:yes stop_codon:yes gene_type:complete